MPQNTIPYSILLQAKATEMAISYRNSKKKKKNLLGNEFPWIRNHLEYIKLFRNINSTA